MTTVWTRAADYAFPKEERYLADPVLWAKERARIDLWSKQQEVIESVRDNAETAVHSCHNTGKSFNAAVACCWWLDAHPEGSAFVVTTAPTGPQVKAILWREIGRVHKAAGLSGRTNLTEWYMGGELVAYGRKPSEHDPTGFQGIHAEFVLVVLDEACGIPKTLWDAASSLTSNDGSRTLAIGNPDDPHSEFEKVCRPGSGWKVIHIGWQHTPNHTGEPVNPKVRASLISKKWVNSRANRWGKKSALFASKVLGIFPTDSESGVVPWSWAIGCRYLQLPAGGIKAAGLDVGGGGDRTVLRERVGWRAGREIMWDDPDPMELCAKIVATLQEWEIERLVVDVIGIGWGLAGRIKELSRKHQRGLPDDIVTHGAEVVGFNASQTAKQAKRFINRRAELHWEVGRELSRLKLWDLEEVDDDVMAELTEAQYTPIDSSGKIKIEPKALIKQRLGQSPDRADALLMAFWEGDSVAIQMPASAKVLGTPLQSKKDTGIAGPRRAPVELEDDEAREAEAKVMKELLAGRPV